MFNGWAAASGEKRIDLSERIAWFCDISNIEGSLVETETPFNDWQFGGRCQVVASGAGSCGEPEPAGPGSVGHEAWGESKVASESEGRESAVRKKRQNKANLLLVLISGTL